MRCLIAILDWVVVSNIFVFSSLPGGMIQFDSKIFKWVETQPPTIVDLFFSQVSCLFWGAKMGYATFLGGENPWEKTHPSVVSLEPLRRAGNEEGWGEWSKASLIFFREVGG